MLKANKTQNESIEALKEKLKDTELVVENKNELFETWQLEKTVTKKTYKIIIKIEKFYLISSNSNFIYFLKGFNARKRKFKKRTL